MLRSKATGEVVRVAGEYADYLLVSDARQWYWREPLRLFDERWVEVK